MTKNFECNKGTSCGGRNLCCSDESHPTTSVGDLIRISQKLGVSLEEFWHKYGFIHLERIFPESPPNIALGISHSPCPFLDPKSQYPCQIHEVKPVTCLGFPLLMYETLGRERLEKDYNYPCLVGLDPDEKQMAFVRALKEQMREENKIDEEFWKGFNRTFYLPTTRDVARVVLDAVNVQQRKDPQEISLRAKRFFSAVDNMNTYLGRLIRNEITGIPAEEYIENMGNIVFTLVEDEIVKRLKEVDSRRYERTTQMRMSLNSLI